MGKAGAGERQAGRHRQARHGQGEPSRQAGLLQVVGKGARCKVRRSSLLQIQTRQVVCRRVCVLRVICKVCGAVCKARCVWHKAGKLQAKGWQGSKGVPR